MIISGCNLSKSYNNRKVLEDVTISCSAGEICGLLGANGAGKTTLLKILLGLVTPDSGTVTISANRTKPIGGIVEEPALYEYLNARDNLKIFGGIQGVVTNTNFLTSSLLKVGLPLDRKDPVGNFSMGMKQRLGIAVALLNHPACLVLDEPFNGLDPLGVAALQKLILELTVKEDLAVILSSHVIEELSKTCSTLYVLKEGRIVNRGPTKKLIAENSNTYCICAENIVSSQSLKEYHVSFKGNNDAFVTISPDQIAHLIQQLYQEQIYITSCSPKLSMERLFEISGA
jgi:ABC-2 type transport system ATP-binding protein